MPGISTRHPWFGWRRASLSNWPAAFGFKAGTSAGFKTMRVGIVPARMV
jgi:hypothetical protein